MRLSRKQVEALARDWDHVRSLVQRAANENGGRFPTATRLREMFGAWLPNAIMKHHGGMDGVRSRMGFSVVNADTLKRHAEALVNILAAVQLVHSDLTSDDLWSAIKKRMTGRDLLSAIGVYRNEGGIDAFLRILSPEAEGEQTEIRWQEISVQETTQTESVMKSASTFFARPASEVAQDLVGRTIIRRYGTREIQIVLTEISAHEGGQATTPRMGMAYAPGMIFIMPFRGRLFFNVATGREGEASCVFLRGGIVSTERDKPLQLDGPIKLAKHLHVTKSMDGVPFRDAFSFEGDAVNPALVIKTAPATAAENCIGVFSLRK